MTSKKIFEYFFLTVCISVIFSFFVGDMIWRSNIVKGLSKFPHPKPYYGLEPVPGTSLVPNSDGVLGADFSQVFFPAKAIRHGESAYNPNNPEFRDPFGRPPAYPPLTIHLYVPLTFLPYHQALLIHNFGTMLLFFGLTAFFLKKSGLQKYFWKILILYILLSFYTTIGFSHFERGQFDFFVSSSFMLIYFCVFLPKSYMPGAIGSGSLGALKLSSVPFIACFSGLALFGTESKKRWIFLFIPGIILFSALIFLSGLFEFWPILQHLEFKEVPRGISFCHLMPRIIAKGFPLLSTLIIFILFMVFSNKKSRIDLFKSISFPFALAIAIQGMCYGTCSFEYRAISFLGFVPALLLWIEKAKDVTPRLKILVAAFFALFLIIAFRLFDFLVWDKPDWNAVIMSAIYLISSFYYLSLCVYFIVKKKGSLETIKEVR